MYIPRPRDIELDEKAALIMVEAIVFGRTAMAGGRMLVDPKASYLAGRRPNLKVLYKLPHGESTAE